MTFLLFEESLYEVVPPSMRKKQAKSAALAFLRQNKSCIALRLTQLNWSALLTALFHWSVSIIQKSEAVKMVF